MAKKKKARKIRDAKALAAAMGRAKFGRQRIKKLAAAGKKRKSRSRK